MANETDLVVKIRADSKEGIADLNKLQIQIKELDLELKKNKGTAEEIAAVNAKVANSYKEVQESLDRMTGGTLKYVNVSTQLFHAQNRQAVGFKSMATSIVDMQKASQQSRTALLSVSQAIQDAPYGIRGMSNNIDFLAQQFLVLRANAGSTGNALKLMFTSLGTASGVLIGFSIISAGVNYFSNLKNSIDNTTASQIELTKELVEFGDITPKKGISELNEELDTLYRKYTETDFWDQLWGRVKYFSELVFNAMVKLAMLPIEIMSGLHAVSLAIIDLTTLGKMPTGEKFLKDFQKYRKETLEEFRMMFTTPYEKGELTTDEKSKGQKIEFDIRRAKIDFSKTILENKETELELNAKNNQLSKSDLQDLIKIAEAQKKVTKESQLIVFYNNKILKYRKDINKLEENSTKKQETETEQSRENLLVAKQILLNSEKLKSNQAYLSAIEKKIEDKKFQSIISSKELMDLHLKDGKISEQELELQRELESLLSEQQATKKAIITDAENLNKLTYNAFVEAEQFKNKDKLLTNQEQIDQNKLFITKAEELGLTKEQIKLLQENLKLNVQITQDQLSINKEKYDGLQNEIDQKYISKELTNQQYIFELNKLLVIAEQNGLLNEARRIRMKIAQVAQKDDLGDLFKKGIKDSVLNGFDQMINKISFMNDKFNTAGISFKAFSEIMLTEISRIILKMIALAAVEAIINILNPFGAAAKAGTDLLSNSKGFASGGYINEPVVGMGRSGRMYSIAEKGSELIIPNNRLANNMNSSRGAGGGAMNVIVTGKLKGRDIYLSNVRESHQISRLSY